MLAGPAAVRSLPAAELDALGRDLPEQIVSDPTNFVSFLRNRALLEVSLNAVVEPKIHWNSLENPFFYLPLRRCLRAFDIDYAQREILRNCPLRDFIVVENLPAVLYDQFAYPAVFATRPQRSQLLLCWSKSRLVVARDRGVRVYAHALGTPSACVARMDEAGPGISAAFLVESPRRLTITAARLDRDFRAVGERAFERETQLRISAELTHFMVIRRAEVLFLAPDLRVAERFALARPLPLLPNTQPIFFRSQPALLFETDSACQLYYLASGRAVAFRKASLVRFNCFQDEFFFVQDRRLRLSMSAMGLESSVAMGRVASVHGLQVNRTHLFLHSHKRVLVKELNTCRTYALAGPGPFDFGLSPRHAAAAFLSLAHTPAQLERFRSARAQADGARAWLLADCYAVATGGRLQLYELDTGELRRNFGSQLLDQLGGLFALHSEADELEVLDGSLRHSRLFVLKTQLFAIAISPDTERVFQAGLSATADNFRCNVDFSRFVAGGQVFALTAGEFVPLRLRLPKNLFATLDRRYLIGFEDNGQFSLDPVELYSFSTLARLWRISLFDRPEFPLPLVSAFIYAPASARGYLLTAGETYVFDARKRFNNREFLAAQALVVADEAEIRGTLAANGTLFADSPIFEMFLHPIVCTFYNMARSGYSVWDQFEYPAHVLCNSPLMVASQLPHLQALDHMLEFLRQSLKVKPQLFLSRDEFYMLARKKYPKCQRLLALYFRRLTALEQGFGQRLEPRGALARGSVVVISQHFAFDPEVLRELTGDPRSFLPSNAVRLAMPKPSGPVVDMRKVSFQPRPSALTGEAFYLVGAAGAHGGMPAAPATAPAAKAAKAARGRVRPIEFYRLQADVDFSIGTRTSAYFLKLYKNSPSAFFVLSPYRFIIDDKWSQLRYIGYVQAFFFAWLVGLYFALLFAPQTVGLLAVVLFLFASFLGVELATAAMDYRDYFREYENDLGLFGTVAGLGCAAWGYAAPDPPPAGLSALRLLSSLALFFRCLAHLKVLPHFTSLLTMVLEIAFNARNIMLLAGLAVLAAAALYAKTAPDATMSFTLLNMFASLFGNIDSINPQTGVQWFVMITMTLFLSTVLASVVVAVIAHEYAALDAVRELLVYRHRARLCLQNELRYRLGRIAVERLGLAARRLVGRGTAQFVAERDPSFNFVATRKVGRVLEATDEYRAELVVERFRAFTTLYRQHRHLALNLRQRLAAEAAALGEALDSLRLTWQRGRAATDLSAEEIALFGAQDARFSVDTLNGE